MKPDKLPVDHVYTCFVIFLDSKLSYADTNPILSDRTAYPNFFRTVPSDSDYNPARIQLLHKYEWKRVGTLFQDASRGSSRYAYVCPPYTKHTWRILLTHLKLIRREDYLLRQFTSDSF